MRQTVFLSAGLALLLAGCGGKTPDRAAVQSCVVDGVQAPAWVCEPQAGGLTGLGMASPKPKEGYGARFNRAQSAAWQALGVNLEAVLQTALDAWYEEARLELEPSDWIRRRDAVVARSIEPAQANARLIDRFEHPGSKTLHVLAGLEASVAAALLGENLKNDELLWLACQNPKTKALLDAQLQSRLGR